MKKKYTIVGICIILFLIMMLLVLTNNISGFDDRIYNLVYGNHNMVLDTFFKHFTKIGNTIPTIFIAILLIILFRKKKEITLIISSLALTIGTNQLLKHIIQRPRPPLERRLIKQGGYSFPSGHSMAALCIYGILIYFCMTKIKKKSLKILFITLLTIMILLIGISRIYVGVHYPSDVFAGYLLSIAILITDIAVVNHHFKGE